MPVLNVGAGGRAGVVNESGKVQILYRGSNAESFNPGDVVPADLAFMPDGSVHPSLLAPPQPVARQYKRCGCARDLEEDDEG